MTKRHQNNRIGARIRNKTADSKVLLNRNDEHKQ